MAADRIRADRTHLPRPFGPFTLEKEIGKGSRSAVYLARDERDGVFVALKLLAPSSECPLEEQRKNMEAEAWRLRMLLHPNIIGLRQRGEIEEMPYLSFPYIEGKSLDQVLSEKAMAIGPLLDATVKVCHALGHAHSRGLIHRDLKPRNIIIDRKGEPFVLDWGLSWQKGSKREPNVQSIVGTPAYMSPEQVRGEEEKLTDATDVYSMGAILYHVVTGKPPFVAETSWKTMQMTMSLPPHPPSKLRTTIDLKLERVILWCLEKDPERRYRDGTDLAEDLQRAVHSDTPKGPAGLLKRLFKKRK
jgi:serine/threonine protein kinase